MSPAQCEPRPTLGPVGHPQWPRACPLESRAALEDKVRWRVPPGPGTFSCQAPLMGAPVGVLACCLREQEPACSVLFPGQRRRGSQLCARSVHTMVSPPILQTRVCGGVSQSFRDWTKATMLGPEFEARSA